MCVCAWQYALERSRSTGFVKQSQTYYSGCYILGPDAEFVYFPASGQLVELQDLEVFTKDRLAVKLSLTFQYHLR